jgi:hypothetical protein
MTSVIIYQDRPDNWQYDASAQEMRNYGVATKKIVYVDGELCLLDTASEAKLIIIPVSRWKLVKIGLHCIMAALRG